jgi:hypothetical protein
VCGGSMDDELAEIEAVARMLSEVEAYLGRRAV